jgi:hypothetical protein
MQVGVESLVFFYFILIDIVLCLRAVALLSANQTISDGKDSSEEARALATVNVENAVVSASLQMMSIGRYGRTSMLCCFYGSSELSQVVKKNGRGAMWMAWNKLWCTMNCMF